jgi:Protein of unknown function (DUF3179)
MRRPGLTATVMLAAALVIVAVAGDGESPPQDAPARDGASSEELRFDKSGWKTDFSKHDVPLTEFISGGPPRDGIPPVDEPKPTSQTAAERWLSDREPVLAVELGDQVRAYPLQILVWHEIVNDTLGDRPIAVTYCPLCNSAIVFDRRVGGRETTFGTTGKLRKSDLVMWDRATQSWWQQLTGEALVGALTGARLRPITAQTLSWADFKARCPEGTVLSRDTGFHTRLRHDSLRRLRQAGRAAVSLRRSVGRPPGPEGARYRGVFRRRDRRGAVLAPGA